MPAEPSRWQDNVRFSQLPLSWEGVCLCVFADPVRKISEVSMWVKCGEWRRQDENRRLTHESDAPKRSSGSRGVAAGRDWIGERHDNDYAVLFRSRKDGFLAKFR